MRPIRFLAGLGPGVRILALPSLALVALVVLAVSEGPLSPPPSAQGDSPAAESPSKLGAANPGAAKLGAVHFESSGPAEAQEPFLQGLAALHSFFYDEAADYFREAEKRAPDFAMAYWGEAMTYNHPIWRQQDLEGARAVLDRLGPTPEARAAKAPTERERAYLRTLEILYGEGSKAERDQAYSEELKRLAARWPRDVDASAFYALSLQGLHHEGTLGLQDRMRSAAILEQLFDRNPDHPGVLHYMIHAYDDPIHAPLGLRAAVLYARVAPAAHHALHMPSHIFLQLGMWDRVVASNEDAYRASVEWVEKRGLSHAREDFHSLSWLSYGYLQQGRYQDADRVQAVIDQVAVETGDPSVREHAETMAARRVLESRQWKDLPVPEGADASGLEGVSLANEVFVSGLGAAERGDLETARRAHARLVERLEGLEDPSTASKILPLELDGWILLREGKGDEALARLKKAAALEDSMELPSGPVRPIKPAHEIYGEALLELDRAKPAMEQFDLALQRTANRALSLLGSARAAAAAGDTDTARERYGMLAAIWKQADPGLAEVAEVRTYLRGQPAAGR